MGDFYVNIDVNDDGDGILESSHLDSIRKFLSCENPKRKNAPSYVKRHLPKRIYFIDKDGVFPIGLVNEIFSFVKTIKSDVSAKEFKLTDRARYFYEPSFLLPKNYSLYKFEGWEYRDVQEKALEIIFRRGRGIIDVGTAGGKGLVFASIIRTLQHYNPTQTFAVIVPTHLVLKTVNEFCEDYGFTKDKDITGWSGKTNPNPDFNVPVIVVGSRMAGSRKEEFEEKIATRSVCIIDECHIVKYDGLIIERIRTMKTNNIIGLTGSVPLKPENRISVLGNIGKIVYKVPSRELKEKGYKADSKVIPIKFVGSNFKSEESDKLKAYNDEKKYVLLNVRRNQFIKDWIMNACSDGNVLIPIDLDYHEQLLAETFEDCGREVIIINGKTPEEEREEIYNSLEHKTDAILIVKVGIMREGISIKSLSYMVGYYIGTSFERIVQLLGRIERLGGNEVPIFYDFYDDLTFSRNQFKKRLEIYKREQLRILDSKSVNIIY